MAVQITDQFHNSLVLTKTAGAGCCKLWKTVMKILSSSPEVSEWLSYENNINLFDRGTLQ